MQQTKPPCPYCHSQSIVKNGSTHHKKQKYKCKDCGRQFIENPQKKYVSDSDKFTIQKLLLERISLAGIARAIGVSVKWLQKFVNNLYRHIRFEARDIATQTADLVIECDEMWSYVNSTEHKVWVWLAFDRNTKQIVGLAFGDRSRDTAMKLWNSLPESYRSCAICYTDFWQSIKKLFLHLNIDLAIKKVVKLII